MHETDSFHGTQAQRIVDSLDGIYAGLDFAQEVWKNASPFQCPDGCGSCCVDFEPDILECEALYLAAWMLEHQSERADAILTGTFASPRTDSERGCFLFDPGSPFHCTVYGGRCLICRLFGYTGDRGKDGLPRWKPCKFLPESFSGADAHRQFSAAEMQEIFGAVPPVMADITAQVTALSPDEIQNRKPLREALPLALAKIRMLQHLSVS